MNKNLLTEAFGNSGLKLAYIAKALGLTYTGLKNKVDGRCEFKCSEMGTLRTLLNLSPEQVTEIFFPCSD